MTNEEINNIKDLLTKVSFGEWAAPCLSNDNSSCNCKTILDECYAGGLFTVHVDNGLKYIGQGANDCPPLEEAKANGLYVAALNPSAVSRLLDRLDKVEKELTIMKAI